MKNRFQVLLREIRALYPSNTEVFYEALVINGVLY